MRRASTGLELAVLDEINRARTNPTGYARTLRSLVPSSDVQAAIAFLERQTPVPALTLDQRLEDAARAHAGDVGPRGSMSHTGADGSTPMRRAQALGLWSMRYAEVIAVSESTAAGVVRSLIIDAGVPRAPHREDLFNPNLTAAGVACGPNTAYRTMCVIDLSGAEMQR